MPPSLPEVSRFEGELLMDKSLPLQKAISTDIFWNQPSRPPGATDIPLHSFKSVICPVCGDDYIHFGETKVFERDDKVVLGDYWYDVGWEGRGDLLVIPMWGECGSRWEICFGHYKGNTATFIRLVEPCEQSYVYFIEGEGLARIKIGYSEDPEKRLKQLSTGSPTKLRLVKKVRGDADLEKELHKRFEHLRYDKEWFHATRELTNYIEGLVATP